MRVLPVISSRSLNALGAALVAVMIMIPVAGAGAAVHDTELVSRESGNGPGGEAMSSISRISANGRFVAFISDANNLSSEDDDGVLNVFVRDRQTGNVELVNRATGQAGAPANGGSVSVAVSANGRFVAFDSTATNLVAGVGGQQIYVRDLESDVTELVSRADGAGGAPADSTATATDPSISANGRYVSFAHSGSNLSASDSDPEVDVFVRDRVAHTTTWVSRADGRNGGAPEDNGAPASSGSARISGSGRAVVFVSQGNNLTPEDGPASYERVFVRYLDTGLTRLVSRASFGGPVADDQSERPAISLNGRYIAFVSKATNLGGPDDGDLFNVYWRDLENGTMARVDVGAQGVPANFECCASGGRPAVSRDGNVVAFESAATNLKDAELPGAPFESRVYTRDMTTGFITLVSRESGANGAPGRGARPAISENGQYVAFDSVTAFSPSDTNNTRDVYTREIGPPASDGLANVSVTRTSAPSAVKPGALVTASITVQNHDTDDVATNVTVVEDLPAQLTWASVQPAGADASCSHDPLSGAPAGTVVCFFETVGQGASKTIKFSTQVLAPGAIKSVADLSADNDSDYADNRAAQIVAPVAKPACSDGADNDKDGRVDGADAGCSGPTDTDETNKPAVVVAVHPNVGCPGRALRLIEVYPSGKRVRLMGVAPSGSAGATVTLHFGPGAKRVAKATVRPDLSFSTTAMAPKGAAARGSKARYEARLGELRSAKLKLNRRLFVRTAALRNGRIVYKGRVVKPFGGRPPMVRLRAASDCGKIGSGKIVRSVKARRDGMFSFTVPVPSELASARAIYLRAEARVRKNAGGKGMVNTSALVRGVRLR